MKKSGRKDPNRELKDRCVGYIRKTQTLPEAQELAKREGFSANFSVWLSAANEMLKDGWTPGK